MFLTKKYNEHFCYAGLSTILIDNKGNVWPCQACINNDNFYMGNIIKEKVEVANLKNYNKIVEYLSNINKSKIKYCDECIERYWCKLCLLNNYLYDEKSNYFYDEERCDFYKLITEITLEKISELVKNDIFYEFSLNVNKIYNDNTNL